ncbi:histone deacetylase [Linderina pennispora]|nr:histone deacetylase [Linderina pennispora]
MTCSFHKYGEFFPGTGDLRDIGEAKGKYYAVNFPLRDGIDDVSYQSVFKPVIQHIMDWYQPNAVVLQCGTDSLAGDKLGCFNLSMDGHAECVRFVKNFNLPTLVLGGGGYTIRNVSRVWAYETGILVGSEMDRKLPMNDYMDYYAPEYSLNVPAYNVENCNSAEYLERMMNQVIQNLERTKFVPSVQVQDVPRDVDNDIHDEDALDPEERMPEPVRDQHVVPDTEMYDADAMGLKDETRDSTKVINEEIHDKDDVEMEDVTNGADKATAESSIVDADEQPSKGASKEDAMDVDGAEVVPETAVKEEAAPVVPAKGDEGKEEKAVADQLVKEEEDTVAVKVERDAAPAPATTEPPADKQPAAAQPVETEKETAAAAAPVAETPNVKAQTKTNETEKVVEATVTTQPKSPTPEPTASKPEPPAAQITTITSPQAPAETQSLAAGTPKLPVETPKLPAIAQVAEKEEGEATEDDDDDEEGEIKDS